MSSSLSTLNPYAQSYIPLAEREVKNKVEDYKILPGEAASSDGHPAPDDLKLKGQQVDYSHGVPSQIPHEMDCKLMDEEPEMDLAYLQMMFPGISDQSLVDVYNVNMGDVEAAVDMLNHLESADNLPDAWDTGDVQDPVPLGESSSVKVKNAPGESSCSSDSSDMAVAT